MLGFLCIVVKLSCHWLPRSVPRAAIPSVRLPATKACYPQNPQGRCSQDCIFLKKNPGSTLTPRVEKLSSSNIPRVVVKLLLGPQPHLETRWLRLGLSLFVLWPQLACEDHNDDLSRNPALTHLPTTPWNPCTHSNLLFGSHRRTHALLRVHQTTLPVL